MLVTRARANGESVSRRVPAPTPPARRYDRPVILLCHRTRTGTPPPPRNTMVRKCVAGTKYRGGGGVVRRRERRVVINEI